MTEANKAANYAVIFTAHLQGPGPDYAALGERLRAGAKRYGCLGINSVYESDREITVSYWETLDQIQAWKQDPEHQEAQALGRSHWHRSYQVQVCAIERQYIFFE